MSSYVGMTLLLMSLRLEIQPVQGIIFIATQFVGKKKDKLFVIMYKSFRVICVHV